MFRRSADAESWFKPIVVVAIVDRDSEVSAAVSVFLSSVFWSSSEEDKPGNLDSVSIEKRHLQPKSGIQ